MIFTETPLEGAYLIDLEPIEDNRGFFARSFCETEFARQGLDCRVAQCNVSFNRATGTLRGLHYQNAPDAEAKLVRCTTGAIFDAIVDLRPESASFGHYFCVELSAGNRRMLFIPAGFAHGFQTLVSDTEVFYQMSTPYIGGAARGIRFDSVGIPWPRPVTAISPTDLAWPALADRA